MTAATAHTYIAGFPHTRQPGACGPLQPCGHAALINLHAICAPQGVAYGGIGIPFLFTLLSMSDQRTERLFRAFSFFKRRRLLVALLLLAALALTLVAFVKKQTPAPPVVTATPVQILEFLPADLATATQDSLRQVLPLSGTLRALNQVVVKARVSGEVREVLVRAGEPVSAGQLLIRMDTSEYQAKLAQAKGSLVAAQGQFDIAAKTLDNNAALLDKGFISRNAFDNAASQFDIARANVDTARGTLGVAQKALDDTIIKAPIQGTISSRTIEPGEKVSPDNKLLEIVDLRQLEMEAPVPAAEVIRVRPGQEVLVRAEGMPDTVPGKVARINPATEANSRSIMVYVRIDNPRGLLRAGMFAGASLTLSKRDAVVTVPQTAIRRDGGHDFVYVIDQGKLHRRAVDVGLSGIDSQGSAVEITAGLAAGTRIVKVNLGTLNDGAPVRILPAAKD